VTPNFEPESRFFVPIFLLFVRKPGIGRTAPGTARTGTLPRACVEYFEIISQIHHLDEIKNQIIGE
jgi:hypothetical protein